MRAGTSWTRVQSKSVDLGKIKDDQLPPAMRTMSLPQKEKYVRDLAAQRAEIQKKINDANEKRRMFVANAVKNAPGRAPSKRPCSHR